jgi:ketosteroid isomerase-like protein
VNDRAEFLDWVTTTLYEAEVDGLERTSVSVDGQQRSYILRVTQAYRREGGEWKVVHRHGDFVTE